MGGGFGPLLSFCAPEGIGQLVGALRQARSSIRSSLITRLAGFLVAAIVIAFLSQKVYVNGASYFASIVVIGVATGAIYALIAIGYTMVYGIVELINFAHGDVFTLGAFLALPLLVTPFWHLTEAAGPSWGMVLPLIIVFLVVMLITGLVNVGIERVAYRPLRSAPRLAPLITAVGVSFLLEGVMYLWKGAVNLHFPDLLPSNRFLGGIVGAKDLIVVLVTVALVVGLALFVNLTKLGKAMRATAQDRDAARLMGINIDRTISATFFIGAVLAGAGGIVFGLYENVVYNTLGFPVGLVAFTAAVFGGIGNIPGAALGGLCIGLIRASVDGYIDPSWDDVVIFAILILVLTLRPTGLLGMRVPEK
jgi:branched-chain amino acid transport system permease protein